MANCATELDDKVEYLARLYKNLPHIHSSNKSLTIGLTHCLQDATQTVTIYKWDHNTGRWLYKKVTCEKLITVLIKNPLDAYYSKMRISLALSEPQKVPHHWDNISTLPYLLTQNISHKAEWKYLGSGFPTAKLPQLTDEEVHGSLKIIKTHLVRACSELKINFIKKYQSIYPSIKIDCNSQVANLENADDAQMVAEWKRMLLHKMQELQAENQAAYYRIIQNTPWILMLSEYRQHLSFENFLSDQDQIARLQHTLSQLSENQDRAHSTLLKKDSDEGLTKQISQLRELGPAEKEKLYKSLMRTFNNLDADLATDLATNSEIQSAVTKDLEQIRKSQQNTQLALNVGSLAICIMPYGRVLKLVKIAATAKTLELVACLSTTFVINATYMVSAVQELHQILDDANNFSQNDRALKTTQLESLLKEINPIYLFF